MYKKTSKWLGLAIILSMLIVALAACSGNKNNNETAATNPAPASTESATAPATPEGLDISKHVNLEFWMLGDAPRDLKKVQDEINKMAEEDLNVTVKFNFTTWTDWDQKYKLMLSTGQPVDLIFTADWTQYQSYAKMGAFLPLDDLLPKAGLKLQELVPQNMWDAVRINGKIYTVPATYKEYVTNGFVWREDLRKKYNLPKPVDVPSFEAYLEGIKKNEANIQPVAIGAGVQDSLQNMLLEIARNEVGQVPYGMFATYDDPTNMTSYWGSPEQLEDLKLFKKWMDKGYFSKNVLNEQNIIQMDKIINGTAASMFGDNPNRFNEILTKMKAAHPDWELEYYPFPLTKGYATPVHPIHNGFAIPKASKNPERALAFYEKMVTDKRYNLLTQYGFEGVNYKVENGYYETIGEESASGFPREGMHGWAWRNPEYMLFPASYDGVNAIFKELDKIEKPDIYTGFAENYTEYQAERAALEQVAKQYLWPLIAGRIDDVEDGLKTFMSKANQAGLEKVQEEYKKQWLAYLQEQGIK
ncbi:ABC transporter substrate-binding protein [Cohnella abietis]|uniref:ABC transporter substrate-binding protein n=2 Tax=Cohnella abietis TaxID=2507935 RepID=A0A3T1DD75_9BACL|nr:extracellular solute-binding protein [Cohnella abietis]BBI35918.1 ABC transporter substrate-binding protein [Cohnella abietis]